MSADPFANTTTVKNILQHIISPKIVSDGSGGYVTKTDLVNVDNILFTAASTTSGSSGSPLTSQCGIVDVNKTLYVTVYHSRVTTNSIILASVRQATPYYVTSVVPSNGSFRIYLNASNYLGKVNWFIASF